MKSCPSCNRTYTDASLNFCLEDGTPLINSAAPGFDPNATIRYSEPRDTTTPRPDVPVAPVAPAPPIYQAATPVATHGSSFGQQQPHQLSRPGAQVKKSSAAWWIIGGILIIGVIAVGAVIMIIAIARMGSNSNANSNRANANSRIPNRNSNANNANVANANSNATLPASLVDNFSEAKWGTGKYDFGEIWYADDQYHMRSKARTYLVMYAPSTDYKTGNATVRVTARSVDGTSPATGYGLIVHGEKRAGQLEDYALLIYTGTDPKYEIIKHKDGTQTEIVPWVASKVIRSGTNPNQLEVRAKGSDLSFYINGQFVERIKDSENFKGGIAGLYTSDTPEVAFDDLEINR
ncbi:MAG TPA: hypothetical protein VGN90_16600 [Pyrinomonadaceae bacterium]|jgi:hypothetical protein|nr:hypothetical protein [Pyrinomonadaceae bacterium]